MAAPEDSTRAADARAPSGPAAPPAPEAQRAEPEIDRGAADERATSTPDERLTSPVELLWDLVFVFAVTQVTTLLALHLSWAGLGRSMLVLALVWWAWSAFVWAANAEDAGSPTLRAALLVALLPIFIVGLTIPEAFGAEAVLFATAYAGMRVATLHSGAMLAQSARLALCGGVALYLAGHAVFRLRLTGSASIAELAAAGAVALVWLAGGGLPAWSVGALAATVLAVLCAVETRMDRLGP